MPRTSPKRRGATLPGPLALRTSGVDVTPDLREDVRWRVGRRLGKFGPYIERVTVRFEDVNGPRGGVDTMCRIKVVLSGLASVVVEETASDASKAFNRADGVAERVVRRVIGRARVLGSLVGRRPSAGRAPVRSSSRAAGGTTRSSTAARNFKRNTRRATAALEDSATGRPSRKSTRGSSNRAKQGNKLKRRQVRRVTSPKGRRAQANHRK